MRTRARTPEEYDTMLELEPVAKIRAAEELMRDEHPVLGGDYPFWGNIADHLNEAANIPSLTGPRPRDIRVFNRAQDTANSYIEMSARLARERAQEGTRS